MSSNIQVQSAAVAASSIVAQHFNDHQQQARVQQPQHQTMALSNQMLASPSVTSRPYASQQQQQQRQRLQLTSACMPLPESQFNPLYTDHDGSTFHHQHQQQYQQDQQQQGGYTLPADFNVQQRPLQHQVRNFDQQAISNNNNNNNNKISIQQRPTLQMLNASNLTMPATNLLHQHVQIQPNYLPQPLQQHQLRMLDDTYRPASLMQAQSVQNTYSNLSSPATMSNHLQQQRRPLDYHNQAHLLQTSSFNNNLPPPHTSPFQMPLAFQKVVAHHHQTTTDSNSSTVSASSTGRADCSSGATTTTSSVTSSQQQGNGPRNKKSSSSSTSSSSSSVGKTKQTRQCNRSGGFKQRSDLKLLESSANCKSGSRFKNYLTQLLLASNVPFAYTIILVAFLITMIAATSIITILTIVLTLTGYTAYPLTENTFSTSLAIGVVCASFALALVTLSLIVWRRHCQAAYYYLDEPQDASRATNSPQLSETYDDSEYGSIPVSDWMKHVQKLHQDSDIGFSREFEQIQQANQKTSLALTCDHSHLAENKHKNRYINIVAYDHTRVILRPPLGGQKKPGYDYINANFIDGYNKPRAYIGTQGPLVSTFDDYWRMIWEQRVVIIVMITNLQERGRRKCDMYWPKEGTETYGYVQVKLLQEVVMATYTLRTFTIRNLKMKKRAGGSERTVYQYHYTNWPDHGVPDHPLPVLSFVRKSAAANPPGAGAIICHCSAGCGRSGTYIVIDAMLKQIRAKQSINVVDFLKHIRAQRNYLVQTEEQFIFIHDALVEAIESGETEIPSNFIAKYIQLLQTGGGGGGGGGANSATACSIVSNGGSTTKLLNNSGSNYSLLNGLCQSPVAAAAASNGQQPNSNLCVVSANNATSGEPTNQQLVSTAANSNSNLLLASGKSSQAATVSRSQSGQWSLLERQYRLVASFKAKDFCVVSALKPCNKNKNRTLNLIPLEAHRVHITPKPGQDGSDYINATFLMGFNHLHEFIATQHPVQETFSDFWQMVYDHNSQTIVLLTQMTPEDTEFAQFWPQKEDEVDYGSFKVKLIQESTLMKADNGGLIITRDFIMRSNQDDYELQTRIIHCPGWPECCGPLSAVFDLIRVVQQATQQQASQQRLHDGQQNSGTVTIGQEHEPQNGGPIIVVDKFGGTEAATFAVLTTLYKQINFEDGVDVYMYAKLAHLRRPGIWSSQDDYLFLYRAMENCASSLLAAKQQQQQAADKSATAASLTAPISMANLHHHQTMTLDRHARHNKSSSSQALSNALKASTMKRNPSKSSGREMQQQQQQPQHQQQTAHFQPTTLVTSQLNSPAAHVNHGLVASEFLAIKNNQNKQQQQQQQILYDQNHNSLQYSPAAIMQHQQQMGKGSPYNSAASIGAGSHQHLLATSNGPAGQMQQQQQQQQMRQVGGVSNAAYHHHHQQQQQQQQQPASQAADHQYLYSVQ